MPWGIAGSNVLPDSNKPKPKPKPKPGFSINVSPRTTAPPVQPEPPVLKVDRIQPIFAGKGD